ncbi:MAG: PKD domain-containing protein [Pseudolysinimonas sp.]
MIWKCLEVTCAKDDAGAEPITLSDIASFRPSPGVQYMQPDGWMVPGLDANFYAVTAQHVVNGTLLGQPASVRFTPVAFHWNYGDGTAVTRSSKGATWQALGIPEFGPTPTSHVYVTEGTYTIRLTIDFAAEYRFAGSPFYPIDGVIPLPANDLHVSVDGAKTVLVEHDCAANPSGPGC